MKKLSLTVVLLAITLGCKEPDRSDIESKIIDSVQRKCGKSSDCNIKIGDITDFDWDKMYVFRYNTSKEEIIDVVGHRPDTYTEFTRKILFTDDDKIVYYHEFPGKVDGLVDQEIVFEIPDSLNYRVFEQRDATFRVNQVEFRDGIYYKLIKREANLKM